MCWGLTFHRNESKLHIKFAIHDSCNVLDKTRTKQYFMETHTFWTAACVGSRQQRLPAISVSLCALPD